MSQSSRNNFGAQDKNDDERLASNVSQDLVTSHSENNQPSPVVSSLSQSIHLGQHENSTFTSTSESAQQNVGGHRYPAPSPVGAENVHRLGSFIHQGNLEDDVFTSSTVIHPQRNNATPDRPLAYPRVSSNDPVSPANVTNRMGSLQVESPQRLPAGMAYGSYNIPSRQSRRPHTISEFPPAIPQAIGSFGDHQAPNFRGSPSAARRQSNHATARMTRGSSSQTANSPLDEDGEATGVDNSEDKEKERKARKPGASRQTTREGTNPNLSTINARPRPANHHDHILFQDIQGMDDYYNRRMTDLAIRQSRARQNSETEDNIHGFPSTQEGQMELVRQLYEAFVSADPNEIVDNVPKGKVGQLAPQAQAVARITAGYYDGIDVEMACWKILESLRDTHDSDGSDRNRLVKPYHGTKHEQYRTFRERFDQMIHDLRASKALCKMLLDPDYTHRVCDAPRAEYSLKTANSKINQQRDIDNRRGRAAGQYGALKDLLDNKVVAKSSQPPTPKTPTKRGAVDEGSHSSSKRRKNIRSSSPNTSPLRVTEDNNNRNNEDDDAADNESDRGEERREI